jgi:hypothetical protein
MFCHINIDTCKLWDRAEENHVNITGLIRSCVVQTHSTSLWEHLVWVKLLRTILYYGLTTVWGLKSPRMWWCVSSWKVPDFLKSHSAFISWVQHILLGLVIPRIPLGSHWAWRRRHYDSSKYWQPLTQQHNTASHPTTFKFLQHCCKNLKPWTVHPVHSAVLCHTTLAIKITVLCDGGSRFL